MEIICPPEKCTGCAACMNVCPKEAITMQPTGVLRHMHPVIDPTKCIDCHLCEKTCPVNHPKELKSPLAAYAAVSRGYDDLMTSSSGGAAAAFAAEILDMGGVVYGCVQEHYRDIRHRRIDSHADAHKLKGSKYVQSDIGYIYKEVLADLKRKVPVLFTGTPCQIAGLRAFLRKDYDNLYLVDLVCHGVPSQHLLRENVESMLGSGTTAYVNFRRKGTSIARMFGVFVDNCSPVDENKQVFLKNSYITAFMHGLTFRDCCYSCRYATPTRGSDITIADYWGLGKTTLKTDRGISLVLQNTDKGGELIDRLGQRCHLEERNAEEAITGNGQLQTPFPPPPHRTQFLEDYEKVGTKAFRKHLKGYIREYIATYLQARLSRFGRLAGLIRRLPGSHLLYQKLIKK